MVVILSTECSQKLTNSPFGHSGTKITCPVKNTKIGPKLKNTPYFCLKMTKGKQSIKNH
jgi:hypothetical protein